MNGITEIWEAVSRKMDDLFRWAQVHPKFGLLFVAVLLAVWLSGLLFRRKWTCHWVNNGEMWLFDDCKSETKRCIQIILVSIAIACCIGLFLSGNNGQNEYVEEID